MWENPQTKGLLRFLPLRRPRILIREAFTQIMNAFCHSSLRQPERSTLLHCLVFFDFVEYTHSLSPFFRCSHCYRSFSVLLFPDYYHIRSSMTKDLLVFFSLLFYICLFSFSFSVNHRNGDFHNSTLSKYTKDFLNLCGIARLLLFIIRCLEKIFLESQKESCICPGM